MSIPNRKSPGVYVNESDFTRIGQVVESISPVIIGTTARGPAFVPTTISRSYSSFAQVFGGSEGKYYSAMAARSFLKATKGDLTVIRLLGTSGYDVVSPFVLVAGGVHTVLALDALHGSSTVATLALSATPTIDEFTITLTVDGEDTDYVVSLDPSDTKYIAKVLGTSPLGKRGLYVHTIFEDELGALAANETVAIGDLTGVDLLDFSNGYSQAFTPWIRSQRGDDLFRLHTLSDGDAANGEIKVVIENVRTPAEVPGSGLYGSFDVVIRKLDDTDTQPKVLESFTGLNLDSSSPNYILKVIGDKHFTLDGNLELVEKGTYENGSAYIRVEVSPDLATEAEDSIPVQVAEYMNPFGGFVSFPATAFVTEQDSLLGARTTLGFKYDSPSNLQLLRPLADGATVVAGSSFDLNTATLSDGSTSVMASQPKDRKFAVAFQGGFDGFDPTREITTGSNITASNAQGLDLSDNTTDDFAALAAAVSTVADTDYVNVKDIIAPGVIYRLHPAACQEIIDMVSGRGDAFYIMDAHAHGDSISSAVNATRVLDTEWAAAYYDWVDIFDTDTGETVTVPPSVSMLAVFSISDLLRAEWYAPAGLTRGGLVDVTNVRSRLKVGDRDTLYENSINPIIKTRSEGIVAFGQKTFLRSTSAKNRINVRRLLNRINKFAKATAQYSLFENNTASERQKLRGLFDTFLGALKRQDGLYNYRLIIDESNNTPEVIDRNALAIRLLVQPTRAAETIEMSIEMHATGANLSEL